MPVVHFFFDVVSPYAYLAFHLLPQTLEGLACRVNYRPVVLGALLKAHGTPPPVQLPPKRDWIRRHTLWLAGQHGLLMRMPAVHPFRSLPWLRMALASSPHGLPSRYVCETLFQAIWEEGRDPDDVDFQQEIWQAMTALLPEVRDPAGEAVKAELFALGEEALRQGVFGVPTFVLQTASAATGEGRLARLMPRAVQESAGIAREARLSRRSPALVAPCIVRSSLPRRAHALAQAANRATVAFQRLLQEVVNKRQIARWGPPGDGCGCVWRTTASVAVVLGLERAFG